MIGLLIVAADALSQDAGTEPPADSGAELLRLAARHMNRCDMRLADGSWSNENKAYQENNPELATGFAVLTLSYCQKAKK